MNKKLTLGVIGAGSHFYKNIWPALEQCDDIDLCALYSRNKSLKEVAFSNSDKQHGLLTSCPNIELFLHQKRVASLPGKVAKISEFGLIELENE